MSEFVYYYYFLIFGYLEIVLESFVSKLYFMKQYFFRGLFIKIFFYIFRYCGVFCGLNWRIWCVKKIFCFVVEVKEVKVKEVEMKEIIFFLRLNYF